MSDSKIRAMIDEAESARRRAYAPYSNYMVGAAVRSESGRVYTGCNVENAAYPLGQCAEASAIGAMIRAGDRKIVEVVIAGPTDEPCTPCGGCRQRIREFADPDTSVIVCGPGGVLLETTMGELLPHAFTLNG
ncbi:MAG: cytidine deaminase [Sphingomonadales bacterium]